MSEGRSARTGPPLYPRPPGAPAWLVLVAILLSLIAGVELVAAAGAGRAAQSWSSRMAGSATVAVRGRGLEGADAAAARAAEVLARTPGVAAANWLDPAPGDAEVAKVMGLPDASPDGTPPRLLAVTLAPGASGAAPDLAEVLRREGIVASVDNHGGWTGPLERAVATVAAAALGVLLVLLAAFSALVGLGAAQAVRRRAGQVSLLAHFGATDGAIAGPPRAAVLRAVSLGALVGALGAAGLASAALWWSPAAGWLHARVEPISAPDGWDLAAAAIWLPLAVLVGLWAASAGVKAALRSLT